MTKPALVMTYIISFPLLNGAGWIKISSENFDLLTNTNEEEARRTLANFEEVRGFFLREQPTFAGSPGSATIVSFRNFRDYKPYSPKDSTLAYYLRGEDGDYIVMSDLEDARMRVAIHEYVHLLVNHSRSSIPLWLNEGMAEVYSTLRSRNGKVQLGTIQDDRMRALGGGNWIRLPALLRVGMNSPEYNEGNLENMFYAQSCLLTHMLMLGDVYRGAFNTFLDRVATGSAQAAFSDVYGKSVADVERDMNTYFRRMLEGGAVYEAVAPQLRIGEPQPASDVEVGAALANLMAHLGRTEEARKRLRQLMAEYPSNGDVAGALANLEALTGQKQTALDHYRSAVAHDAGGWSVYWNYARLLDDMGGELQPRLQALEAVLQRRSHLTEARLRLARNLCAAGRFSDALARLLQAKTGDGEYEAALLIGMAQASLGLKQDTKAREYLEQAKTAARTPQEKEKAEQLLHWIQQKAAAPEVSATTDTTSSGPESDPERPVLRHRPPPPAKKKN